MVTVRLFVQRTKIDIVQNVPATYALGYIGLIGLTNADCMAITSIFISPLLTIATPNVVDDFRITVAIIHLLNFLVVDDSVVSKNVNKGNNKEAILNPKGNEIVPEREVMGSVIFKEIVLVNDTPLY